MAIAFLCDIVDVKPSVETSPPLSIAANSFSVFDLLKNFNLGVSESESPKEVRGVEVELFALRGVGEGVTIALRGVEDEGVSP
jgi:hypothetical protein